VYYTGLLPSRNVFPQLDNQNPRLEGSIRDIDILKNIVDTDLNF